MTFSHDLGRQTFGDAKNVGRVIPREEAVALLDEWVPNPKLQLHMRQVAQLMREWAVQKEGQDEPGAWQWELAGLLHDADWERYPEEHCARIITELESRNVDPIVLHAIASHGPRYFGVEPVSQMDKMIYAFDELSGFVHAYSLMRGGYEGMEVKSVLKKLKDKGFAAQVSREDIRDAAERAGVSVDALIEFVIKNQLRQ
jgi:predicted hydrolase (HD superfamily)